MGGNPKVNGISSAQPMVAVKPGRAPTTMPEVIPMKTKKKFVGFNITVENASKSN